MKKMARCPECGGPMTTINGKKVCEMCGLALSPAEYDRMMDKKRRERYEEEDPQKRRRREYLEWLHSSKK